MINIKEKCSDQSANLYSTRFDEDFSKKRKDVKLSMIYFSEIVTKQSLNICLEELEKILVENDDSIILICAELNSKSIKGCLRL